MQKHDTSLFQERRSQLVERVKSQHPQAKRGVILLLGNAESKGKPFIQESSFYYLAGISEASVALTVDFEGKATLWIPRLGDARSTWVSYALDATPEHAKECGVDVIKYLGQAWPSYHASLLFSHENYRALLEELSAFESIFTLSSATQYDYVEQKIALQRMSLYQPEIAKKVVDISGIVAALRRKKSRREIEIMYKAVELTMSAHAAAAQTIEAGVPELQVRAGIEYLFAEQGASLAFESIVASGPNSTVLHYNAHTRTMKNGDLVVVDIGAAVDHYCADITRTYPVSGEFTKRQKEIYQIVLNTQEYIAEQARPGVWLNNKDKPAESLNHRARAFLAKHGYDKYLPHGIGHFLGLDVHDVGDYAIALEDGDVITIEPGIYLPAEGIGVRIEDDFWITSKGAHCLSEDLPRSIDDIERLMEEDFEEEDYD